MLLLNVNLIMNISTQSGVKNIQRAVGQTERSSFLKDDV